MERGREWDAGSQLPYEFSGRPTSQHLLASTSLPTFSWSSVSAYVNIRAYGLTASRVETNAESLQLLGRIMEGEYGHLIPFYIALVKSMEKILFRFFLCVINSGLVWESRAFVSILSLPPTSCVNVSEWPPSRPCLLIWLMGKLCCRVSRVLAGCGSSAIFCDHLSDDADALELTAPRGAWDGGHSGKPLSPSYPICLHQAKHSRKEKGSLVDIRGIRTKEKITQPQSHSPLRPWQFLLPCLPQSSSPVHTNTFPPQISLSWSLSQGRDYPHINTKSSVALGIIIKNEDESNWIHTYKLTRISVFSLQ